MPFQMPDRLWFVILFFLSGNEERLAVRALTRYTNQFGEAVRKQIQRRCCLVGWKLIPDSIAMASFWAPRLGCRRVCRLPAVGAVARKHFDDFLWIYKMGQGKDVGTGFLFVEYRCLVSQLSGTNIHATYARRDGRNAGEWVPNHELCEALGA